MGSEKGETKHSIKISLVQHNLPFSEEWRLDHPLDVKNKYEALALKAAAQRPDLIIFPQYTFPGDIYRDPVFFTELAKKTKGGYVDDAVCFTDPKTDKFIADFEGALSRVGQNQPVRVG